VQRANLWLRSGIRVLVQLSRGRAVGAEALYEWARGLPWEEIASPSTTISVDARVRDSELTHSRYAALRIKDALCDRLRDRLGSRPDVDVHSADLPLSLYLWKDTAILYRDSSGTTLHKRGYRRAMHRSSLNECIAAGMLQLAGWEGTTDLVDPMCGSGTILIEAALMALERAPGLLRKRAFPFQRWPGFDARLWESLRAEARERARSTLPCRILGADRHPGAIALARTDTSRASLDRHIELVERDLDQLELPFTPSLVVTNPPWGERLDGDEVIDSWRALGRFLKSRCPGSTAYLLSGNADLTRHLGMRSSRKHPIRIGRIDCRVLEYRVHGKDASAPA
jgi:putative N6-adenine-specific DNA methylase